MVILTFIERRNVSNVIGLLGEAIFLWLRLFWWFWSVTLANTFVTKHSLNGRFCTSLAVMWTIWVQLLVPVFIWIIEWRWLCSRTMITHNSGIRVIILLVVDSKILAGHQSLCYWCSSFLDFEVLSFHLRVSFVYDFDLPRGEYNGLDQLQWYERFNPLTLKCEDSACTAFCFRRGDHDQLIDWNNQGK